MDKFYKSLLSDSQIRRHHCEYANQIKQYIQLTLFIQNSFAFHSTVAHTVKTKFEKLLALNIPL